MRYIQIGNKNVSKLILGTAQFGLDYGISNKEGQPHIDVVNEILKYSYNNGINSFDTAEIYGNAQDILGNFLENKDNKFIISKIEADNFQYRCIDNILNKLKLNKLDVLLLHDNKLLYNWSQKNSKQIHILKSQYKIDYFGSSIYTNEEFELSLNNKDIDVIQIPFNIFDLRAIKNEWLKKAKAQGKLIFIRSIYLQGLLFMDIKDIPKKLEKVIPYIKELNKLVKETKCSKNELLLNFVNTIAENSPIIFGVNSLGSVESTLNTFKSLKPMKQNIIDEIINRFTMIDENIYNPRKW